MRSKHPTLRIQKLPPKRRHSATVWLGRIGVFLGCLAIVGAAAIFGAVSYAETYALKKIKKAGQRAGLDVRVGSVLIQPGSYIEFADIEVSDPADGRKLLVAKRIATDLTITALRHGRRRPRMLVVSDSDLDLSDLERWMSAIDSYRKTKSSKASSSENSSKLPDVLFTNAAVSLPDKGQSIVRVTALSGQFKKRTLKGGIWDLAAAGRSNQGARFSLNTTFDRTTQDYEIGASFDPPLEMRNSHVRATFGSIAVLGNRSLRLADVKFFKGDSYAAASYIQVAAPVEAPDNRSNSLLRSPIVLHLHDLEAKHDGVQTKAASVRMTLREGKLTNASSVRTLAFEALSRLESITTDGLTMLAPKHELRFDANRVLLELNSKFAQDSALSRVAKVRIEGSDTIAALPSSEILTLLPYYKEIETILNPVDELPPTELELPPSQAERDAVGGGPVQAATPRPSRTIILAEIPAVEVEDSTLRLLYPGQTETAFLIGGLEASLTREDATSTDLVTATIGGRIEEIATGEQGKFSFSAELEPTGKLASGRVKVSGRKLAQILATLDDHIRVSDASWLSLDVTISTHDANSGIAANGSVSVRNMGFEAHRVHGTPVDGIAFDADWSAKFYPNEKMLTLDVPNLRLMDAGTLRLEATAENLGKARPKFTLSVEAPTQDCNHLIRSIPPAMIPRLDGLVLDGTMTGQLEISVDLSKPRTYKHKIDVSLNKCRPIQYGRTDVSKLNRSFVHNVVEKGEPIGVTVGPGTWHYRRLHRIPEYVQMGAIATEDHSFFKHDGFRPSLIRRAVIMNLEGGRYVYGGSTITQQLVKNLFLSREKTLTRKLEEAIIVWMVENAVSKKRILELYLNCIEYGPKLYGLENAARAYFGKHVEELNPLDGAFLMGLKPYPWAGWKQFERGYVKPWWHRRLKKILNGMARSGWITQEQLAASNSWEPVFLTSPHRNVTPPPELRNPALETSRGQSLPRPADTSRRSPSQGRKAPLENAPLRERNDTPLDPDAPPAMPNDGADDRPEPLLR